MRIFEIDSNVVTGPWKKPVAPQQGLNLHDLSGKKINKPVDTSNMKKIPLHHVFGDSEFSAILDAGYDFQEKPDYFEDIKKTINVRDVPKIEGLIGRKLNSYQAGQILLPSKRGTYGPQSSADWSVLKDPNERTFIVWFPKTNERFLVNRTGATKYIREWARLVD